MSVWDSAKSDMGWTSATWDSLVVPASQVRRRAPDSNSVDTLNVNEKRKNAKLVPALRCQIRRVPSIPYICQYDTRQVNHFVWNVWRTWSKFRSVSAFGRSSCQLVEAYIFTEWGVSKLTSRRFGLSVSWCIAATPVWWLTQPGYYETNYILITRTAPAIWKTCKVLVKIADVDITSYRHCKQWKNFIRTV